MHQLQVDRLIFLRKIFSIPRKEYLISKNNKIIINVNRSKYQSNIQKHF